MPQGDGRVPVFGGGGAWTGPAGERGSSSSGRPVEMSVRPAIVGFTGGNTGSRHDLKEADEMTPRPSDAHGPRLSPAVRAHLTDSRNNLAEAGAARTPAARYIAAHVAALRAAAAVLAARPRPMEGRRRRLRSAWDLLPEVEPRLVDWAVYFSESARIRAAAEAGMARDLTTIDADELLAEAETFLTTVEDLLGIPTQPTLPTRVPLAG